VKKGFVVFILLWFISPGQAQEKNAIAKITGKVIDSLTNLPLEYATITLFKQGEKKAINGATTNRDGNFTVTDVSAGLFTALIEFIGYKPFTVNNIHVEQKHAIVALPDILLLKKSETLQGVTVTTTAKLIDNKIDKLVFNAEKDLTSQTGVATDILKKVP
jgi:aspartate ammonia-lyase